MSKNESDSILPAETYPAVYYVYDQYLRLANLSIRLAQQAPNEESPRYTDLSRQASKTADSVANLIITPGRLRLSRQWAKQRQNPADFEIEALSILGTRSEEVPALESESDEENEKTDEIKETASPKQPELKEHQREVLQLIAKGRTQYEVADALNVSVGTVSSRMVAMRRRYGMDDLLKLVEHFAGTGEIVFTEEDREALQKRLKSYPAIVRPKPRQKRERRAQSKRPKYGRSSGEILDEPQQILTPEHKKKLEMLFRSDVIRTLNWLQKRIRLLTDDPKLQKLENIESIPLDRPDLLEILLDRGIITPEEQDAKKISRHGYIAAVIIRVEQQNPDKYQSLFLTDKTAAKSMKIIAEEETKFLEEGKKRLRIQY